ncbi:MAG: hypothetical protein Q4P06_05040 [Actinomycetaceae bacterium]|nr:hypothetical protein [Actinomycetaceae bacterium]
MLLKLIRHEAKATWRDLLLIEAAAAVVIASMLALVLTKSFLLVAFARGLASLATVLGAVAVLVWMAVRYYRTVYGDTGYFAGSLPARGGTIWAGKTLWAVVVSALAMIVMVVEQNLIDRTVNWSTTGTWESKTSANMLLVVMLVAAVAFVISVFAIISLSRAGVLARLNPVLSLVITAVGMWLLTQIAGLVSTVLVPLSVTMHTDTLTGASSFEGFSWQYTSLTEVFTSIMEQDNVASELLVMTLPAGAIVGQIIVVVAAAFVTVWLLEKHYTLN